MLLPPLSLKKAHDAMLDSSHLHPGHLPRRYRMFHLFRCAFLAVYAGRIVSDLKSFHVQNAARYEEALVIAPRPGSVLTCLEFPIIGMLRMLR